MRYKCRVRPLVDGSLLAVGWGSFILMWLNVLADLVELRMLVLGIMAVLGLTALAATMWVAYAVSVSLQKSPRLRFAVTVALYLRDRLGRPVDAPWAELKQLRCICISVDASGKHYLAGRMPGTPPPHLVKKTGRE